MAGPSIRAVTIPAIAGSNTLPGSISPAATSTGDMVVAFLWSQGTDQTTLTHTLQSDFTEIRQHAHNDGTTDGRLSIAYKIAPSGSSNVYAPYAVANSTSGQNCIGLVVLSAGTFRTGGIISNSATQTTNAVPNPPSVTGLNGDLRVFAVGAWHVTTAGSTQATAMTNYTITAQNANASHVTHLAIASRELLSQVGSTEDPAAFGDNVAPNGSAIATVAIFAPVIFSRIAALDGAGLIATNGLSIRPRSAILSSVADIVVSGVVVPGFTTHERSAAVDAIASVSSVPQKISSRVAIVDASAVVASIGTTVRPRSTIIASTAVISTVGMSIVNRSTSVDAIAAIASVPRRDIHRAAVVSSAAQIVSVGLLSASRSTTITGAANLAVVTVRIVQRSAALDCLASPTIVGMTLRSRAALINSGASIVSIGTTAHLAATSIAVSAAIATAGFRTAVLQRSTALSCAPRIHVGSSAWASSSQKKSICGDSYSLLDGGGAPKWTAGNALALNLSGLPCDPLSDEAALWSVAGAVMRKSSESGIYFSTSHPGILGLIETNLRIATAAEALAVLNNMSGSGF